MSTFYDSLSLPAFLALTFGFPFVMMHYFWKNRRSYPIEYLIGIMFVCLTGFVSGTIRLLEVYKEASELPSWLRGTPIPFVILASVFMYVGAYKKAEDPAKKRTILFLFMTLLSIYLFVALMAIFKPWK
ncbi:hypothetical protein [Paenibacillus sp. 1P07SE]|uniref:hypothetical protein n=1 Tax=Paenibacillus sp. 1P07SE TaxID=3132209 RepID=UPI0039A4F68E